MGVLLALRIDRLEDLYTENDYEYVHGDDLEEDEIRVAREVLQPGPEKEPSVNASVEDSADHEGDGFDAIGDQGNVHEDQESECCQVKQSGVRVKDHLDERYEEEAFHVCSLPTPLGLGGTNNRL